MLSGHRGIINDQQGGDGIVFLPPTASIRAINRARIISLIRRQGGLTRTQVSEITGLSKGTVSTLVGELLEQNFLWEEDQNGLRQRNTQLWLNRKAGVAVGIELSADMCWGVLTNTEIKPLRHAQRVLTSTHVEETLDLLQSLAEELLADVEEPCLGIAIAVPGPTDAKGQTAIYCESLGWSDVPLALRLAERLGQRVTLISRPRAGVLGEHWYGAGTGFSELSYVSISSGIGAGILIGGQLFTGAFGFNGELGHTTIILDGPECVCGNRGCLEAVASVPAIIKSVHQRLQAHEPSNLTAQLKPGELLSYQDILNAARDGDMLVQDEVKKASRYIGVAVANLVDMFNPQCVIIGGRLVEAGDVVVNTIRETVQRRALPISSNGVLVVKNALGADSAGIGACALVVDQYIAEVEPAVLANS
jgi:predicted NBD/HSP70 family sugar kinase